MVRFVGILLATAGIALLALGIHTAPQVAERVSEILRRAPAENGLLLMAIGAGATALGFALAVAERTRRCPPTPRASRGRTRPRPRVPRSAPSGRRCGPAERPCSAL